MCAHDINHVDPAPVRVDTEAAVISQRQRPRLHLVQGTLDPKLTWSWFCSRCAAVPEHPSASPLARACSACGTGVLRETRSDAVPSSGDAFLVVDSELQVQTLSRAAQMLLGARAQEVIGRPLAGLLSGADAEARDPAALLDAVHAVTTESDDLHCLFVRPAGAFGVRMAAQIAACGPPRAALVVLRGGSPRGVGL